VYEYQWSINPFTKPKHVFSHVIIPLTETSEKIRLLRKKAKGHEGRICCCSLRNKTAGSPMENFSVLWTGTREAMAELTGLPVKH
jgi:hypothetical protein